VLIETGAIQAELFIDSDNNNGYGPPDRNQAEKKANSDPSQPGKIIFANIGDFDKDGIPDYADLEVAGSRNFAQLVLKVAPALDWTKVWITFDYPGEFSLQRMNWAPEDKKLVGRILDSRVPDLRDYTQAKAGTLRLWNIADAGDTRVPYDYRKGDGTRVAGNYVRPRIKYLASDLGFQGEKTFFVEGINADKNGRVPIKVTVEAERTDAAQQTKTAVGRDTVGATVVEPNLGVNNSNSDPYHLRPGVPDVNFAIDKHDEMLEDQGDGFAFWWARYARPDAAPFPSNPLLRPQGNDIVDFAPMVIDLPEILVKQGYRFYLRMEVAGLQQVALAPPTSARQPGPGLPPVELFVYPGIGNDQDRRGYLRDAQTCTDQMALINNPRGRHMLRDGISVPVTQIQLQAGRNELLFKVTGPNDRTATLYVTLYADKPAPNAPNPEPVAQRVGIPIDQVKLTIRPVTEYWLLCSTRRTSDINPNPQPVGNPPPLGEHYYPIDNEYINLPNVYPDARIICGRRDPLVRKHVVMLHGYNVPETTPDAPGNDAVWEFSEMYQRLFWLGFRGNFVGLIWHGTIGDPRDFQLAMNQALNSSTPVRRFLRTVVTNWADLHAEDVDVMAHSLGNLVLWDALRIHARDRQAGRTRGELVHNIVSIQAAIWEEAFEDEEALPYQQGAARYTAAAAGDVLNYTVHQQEEHSWRFWFARRRLNLRAEALSGKAYHSYCDTDLVIQDTMADFDFTWYGHRDEIRLGGRVVRAARDRRWHYHRDRAQPQPAMGAAVLRAPIPGVAIRDYGAHTRFELPSLLNQRTPNYVVGDLNRAIGRIPNPKADYNYNATDGGWRAAGRFDVTDWRLRNHSDHIGLPFPLIYRWFDELLGSGRRGLLPALQIGDQGR
jgi:hypothetical protein